MRIPLKYLANLLTAGKEEPVALGLERMLAMRAYMRAKTVDGVIDEAIAKRVGLTALAIEDMYQTMAIANYEDRFVIPTAHRETNEDALRPARLVRLFLRQRLLGRHQRSQPVRHAQTRQDADGGRVMIKALKALSALLTYPTAELQQAAGEISEAIENEPVITIAVARSIASTVKGARRRRSLRFAGALRACCSIARALCHCICSSTCTAKVATAARPWSTSRRNTRQPGLSTDSTELPDFLPLFLEYASTLPAVEARDALAQPAHILAAMAERLRKRRSAYEAVFRALVALSAAKPKETEVSALLALPDPDPNDLEALDAAWEDEEVRFGPGAGDGCKDGLIARVRGALRPAPDMPAPPAVSPRH